MADRRLNFPIFLSLEGYLSIFSFIETDPTFRFHLEADFADYAGGVVAVNH